MATEFEVQGLENVLDRLRSLPVKLRKKALVSAVRKGAAIVRRAAVGHAKGIDDPLTSERIWKNISVQFRSRASKREGGVVVAVGVRGGARQYGDTRENRRKQRVGSTYKTLGDKGNPGGDTWYWRFVELGTSKVAARPFLRPALENNVDKVTATIAAEINIQLDRLVATNASE